MTFNRWTIKRFTFFASHSTHVHSQREDFHCAQGLKEKRRHKQKIHIIIAITQKYCKYEPNKRHEKKNQFYTKALTIHIFNIQLIIHRSQRVERLFDCLLRSTVHRPNKPMPYAKIYITQFGLIFIYSYRHKKCVVLFAIQNRIQHRADDDSQQHPSIFRWWCRETPAKWNMITIPNRCRFVAIYA